VGLAGEVVEKAAADVGGVHILLESMQLRRNGIAP
jgi:hypothetical protein